MPGFHIDAISLEIILWKSTWNRPQVRAHNTNHSSLSTLDPACGFASLGLSESNSYSSASHHASLASVSTNLQMIYQKNTLPVNAASHRHHYAASLTDLSTQPPSPHLVACRLLASIFLCHSFDMSSIGGSQNTKSRWRRWGV
ncbi:hypothetical protein CLAIMM_00310 isoform 1 [Cladophialophora immunda]|nr:hypothetical protein CLAIMM_00310 isoform 1 [Cladophialophora immunda]